MPEILDTGAVRFKVRSVWMVSLVLRGCDNRDGQLPLHIATFRRDIEFAAFQHQFDPLLFFIADPRDASDNVIEIYIAIGDRDQKRKEGDTREIFEGISDWDLRQFENTVEKMTKRNVISISVKKIPWKRAFGGFRLASFDKQLVWEANPENIARRMATTEIRQTALFLTDSNMLIVPSPNGLPMIPWKGDGRTPESERQLAEERGEESFAKQLSLEAARDKKRAQYAKKREEKDELKPDEAGAK